MPIPLIWLTMGNEVIILFIAIMLTASLSDTLWRKIPNIITFPAMITGLLYHGFSGGLKGLLFSIEGIGLGITFLIVFYILSGMGAGDVKLMGAAGSFLGPKGIFIAFLCTALTGGLIALGVIIFRPSVKATAINVFEMTKIFWHTRRLNLPEGLKAKRVPYGPAIAVGSIIAIFSTMEP